MTKNYYYIYKANGAIRMSTERPQFAQVLARVSNSCELATVAIIMSKFEIREVK